MPDAPANATVSFGGSPLYNLNNYIAHSLKAEELYQCQLHQKLPHWKKHNKDIIRCHFSVNEHSYS